MPLMFFSLVLKFTFLNVIKHIMCNYVDLYVDLPTVSIVVFEIMWRYFDKWKQCHMLNNWGMHNVGTGFISTK